MAELNQYINMAFDYEEKGYVEEAIQLCSKCIQAFPEYKNEIELEIAKMNYRNGKEEQALLQFLMLYQETENSEIRDLILEAYYGVRQQEFEERFRENYKQLKNYPHFFGSREPAEIRHYPIFAGEEWICYYDSVEKVFKDIKRCRINMKRQKDSVCLGSDLLWLEDILTLEKMTRRREPFLDSENAVLLVYRNEIWELLLQLLDLESLIKIDRIIFYDDLKQLEEPFVEAEVDFPSMVVGNLPDEIYETVQESYEKYILKFVKYKEEVLNYYKVNGEAIIRHIKEGKPKILFWTTRFSTALQYHTRDCKAAAEKAGCETELVIEKNRLNRNSVVNCQKAIAKFKPDIIFVIDHFRYEHQFLTELENLVFISWVQDPLSVVMDRETPMKLSGRDFVMNHFITCKEFKEIGYNEKCLIDAPIPANPHIYKPYQLSAEENEKYSCDICFVCHASSVDTHIDEVIENFPKHLHMMIRSIFKGYQSYVYETGNIFYTKEIFSEFIKGAMSSHYGIDVTPKLLKYLAEDMYTWFNERVFRQALVDWILDAGFTNIKLWGNGWVMEEKYKKYAMGLAENGETLSKIYQASKIVIGNNVKTTAAARAWETMLSGGFYLSNYVPMESDDVDIRKIVEIDKEVIMFYSREDLIDKLHYYLEHEAERQEMVQRGRKAALEKMTYDVLMKRVLKEVAERLEENAGGR